MPKHGQNVRHGTVQFFHRVNRDEKCQAAVEPAGDADDGGFCVCMLDALCQPICLHLQNQFTALGARASVCRNERGWGDIAGERNLAKGKMEGNGLIAVGYRLKARIAPPLGKKPSEVQLGAGKRL